MKEGGKLGRGDERQRLKPRRHCHLPRVSFRQLVIALAVWYVTTAPLAQKKIDVPDTKYMSS